MSNLTTILHIAKTDFSIFADIVGANLDKPKFFNHKFAIIAKEIMQYYIDPKQQKHFLFTQHAPPRAGKSVLSTIFCLSYLLGKEADKKMLLMSMSNYTLEQFLYQIKDVINSNIYKAIFPDISFTILESRGRMMIKTNKGGSLLFHSTLSKTPIGSGFHYIWLDDAMHYDAMFSEVQYNTIMRHCQNILTRIENDPKSKVFLNNQILGTKDISEYLKMNFKQSNIPFITLRFQDKYLEDRDYVLPNGQIISLFKDEFLVPWFNDRSQFEAYARIGNEDSRIKNEYKNEPTLGADAIFDYQYVVEYDLNDRDNIIKKCHNFAITTDFAFKDGEANDFTVFGFWGVDIEDKLYLLDLYRKKTPSTMSAVEDLEAFYQQAMAMILKQKLRWIDIPIYTEDVTPQMPINDFLIREKKYYVMTIPRTPGLSKELRAKASFYRFHSKKLHLPFNHHLFKAIKHELTSFSSAGHHLHDDICDNIADALQYIR